MVGLETSQGTGEIIFILSGRSDGQGMFIVTLGMGGQRMFAVIVGQPVTWPMHTCRPSSLAMGRCTPFIYYCTILFLFLTFFQNCDYRHYVLLFPQTFVIIDQ